MKSNICIITRPGFASVMEIIFHINILLVCGSQPSEVRVCVPSVPSVPSVCAECAECADCAECAEYAWCAGCAECAEFAECVFVYTYTS